jgi:DNA processing protein
MTTEKISYETRLAWLRLARSKNIGSVNFFRFLELFGSAEVTLAQLPAYLQRIGSKKQIKLFPTSDAEKELQKIEDFGAELLLFCDENYPQLLREIPDPAPVLTVKGNTELLHRFTIAIVGSRNPSLNAITFTRKLATDLSNNDLVIASGMARGIDSAAHSFAMKNGTIAVIAGGIDHVYPRENVVLYNELAQRGLLIAENPFGAAPEKYHFVQRNRLISGLSLATIVVEANLKSGSLTTAKFAVDQGRDVFAMPGSPLDARCLGSNHLIKEGAKLIEGSADILEEIPSLRALYVGATGGRPLEDRNVTEGRTPLAPTKTFTENHKISAEILQKLSFSPTTIDELIEELQLPANQINCALMELELAERVEVNGDKISAI